MSEELIEPRPVRQGRIAYYAYGEYTGGCGPDGKTLRDWDQLTEADQQPWIVAATAVRSDTLDPDWATRHRMYWRVAPWLRGPHKGENPAAHVKRTGGTAMFPNDPVELPPGSEAVRPEQLPCTICGWYVTPGRHSDSNCHVNQQLNKQNASEGQTDGE